jgi:hypothetical protein
MNRSIEVRETTEMARWSPVSLFLLLFALWPASALAQNLTVLPKMYFALAGSAKDPRQQALIKSLLDDVRMNLRTYANAADKIEEIPKWTADDAPTLVPKEYSRYVVAYVSERTESGLGTVTRVTFEVGRLESPEAGHKLTFAGIPQGGLGIIVAPLSSDEHQPAQFTKLVDGNWQSRANTQIVSEVISWIKAALPELQPQYTFYLMCSEAKRTWTVADILSSESDLDGTVSAFLRKLAQNLEGRWKPPWRSISADLPGPAATRRACGSQDQTLRDRAQYVLRGSLTDAKDIADPGVGRIQGVSVKLVVEDQVSGSNFDTTDPPENAPVWKEVFYIRKLDPTKSAGQDIGDMCTEDIGVLTRNTQFAESVAQYIRAKVYPPPKDSSLDVTWRCRRSEKEK